MPPQRPCQRLLWHSGQIFFWFQKATLRSRLPLNPPRRPRLPLNPSRRLWRPSSMSFGHLPGAFLEIFFWLQKATLGSRLPPNPSRRPCHRLLLHSGGSSLASNSPRRLCRRLLRQSGRFPGAFLVDPSRHLWRPSSMSFGHLPGAFLEIFFWFQKATLGSRLPPNPSRRPCHGLLLHSGGSSLAQQHVLWPPARRFPGDFLLVSESDVRQ